EEYIGATGCLPDETESLDFVESVYHACANWQAGDIYMLALWAGARWRIWVALEHVDFNGTRALGTISFYELYAVTFTERSHSNYRSMDEEVVSAFIAGNESKALLGVEPLYCSCLHFLNSCTALC